MEALQRPQQPPIGASGEVPGVGGDGYTAVLLVHGLGHNARNEALQEAVNALAYWFNHVVGLAMRPQGCGRIWLRTQLTDDDRSDAIPSRVTMELATGAQPDTAAKDTSAQRLEFREIWWARSFGLPSAATGIRWARLLYQQELFRILRVWLVRTSVPQRERPSSSRGPLARVGSRVRRLPLHIGITVYETAQALWKTGQWFVGMPLVFALLFVLGLARRLESVPGLRIIAHAIAGLVSSAWLRWIASMQVYLLDYTRSVAMRDRFEHELRDLLRDERCERIVVLAYSIGTVLAYEGLTNVLSAPGSGATNKPVTFVCLGQMLRRAWRLARTDPHRLRGALPEVVRWVNICARYDPIASGALTVRSLPRVHDWADTGNPGGAAAIRASLAHCDNRIVVNRDSFLYDHDHASYWNNLEQVVGPIARELVNGNPALEALVEAHLASQDDVLARRWSVAWRSSLGLIAGVACGGEALLLGVRYHLVSATRTVVGQLLGGGADLPGFLGLLWRLGAQLMGLLGGLVASLFERAASALVGTSQANERTQQVVVALVGAIDVLILFTAVVGATTLAIVLIEQVLAPPSPTKFCTPFHRSQRLRT